MPKSLTQYLKEIGEEEVTIIVNGNEKKVTRTEALARKMYLMARGGVEEILTDEGERVKIVHKPSHQVAKAIREFTEGKAAVQEQPETKGKAKAGGYDSEVAGRLSDRLGGGSLAVESRPVPSRPRPSVKGK